MVRRADEIGAGPFLEALEPRLLLSASVSGRKFEDLNANGVQDPGECGLDGWTVELIDAATGSVAETAVTDSVDLDGSGDINPETESGLYVLSVAEPVEVIGEPVTRIADNTAWPGFYRSVHWRPTTTSNSYSPRNMRCDLAQEKASWVFEDLPPMEYQVWVAWGYSVSKPGGAEVPYRVYTGGEIVDFAYVPGDLQAEFTVDQSEIPSDRFADGVWWRSLGAYWFEGRTAVEIQGPQNVPEGEWQYALADAVRIEGAPSNYLVSEADQAGWRRSQPRGPSHRVALEDGQSIEGVDFGNYQPCSISGQKFEDLNADGVRDLGEPGLDAWTIELVNSDTGGIVDTQVTDGDGTYSFAEVRPGNYVVREVLQPLWVGSAPTDGEYAISLSSGQDAADVDFGAFFVPAPRVISSHLDQSRMLTEGRLVYTAVFDQELQSVAFELTDELSDPVTLESWDYDAANSTLMMEFTTLLGVDAVYNLSLLSGDGFCENLFGWDLDGEADLAGGVPSGDGIEGGDFTIELSGDVQTLRYPAPFEPVAPQGSLIYESGLVSEISFSGDTDAYSLDLDAGMTVTAASDADVSIQMLDPSGSVLASSTSGVLQSVAVASAGGYTVVVGGAGDSTTPYSLRIALNASVEEETYGGSPNNDMASAQSLDDSAVSLGPGLGERLGVLGSNYHRHNNDWYSVSLNDGESLTVMLEPSDVDLSSDVSPYFGFSLQLYDDVGNLLVLGRSQGNAAEAVNDFVDTTSNGVPNTYYLQVEGHDDAVHCRYSLIATRRAHFDHEVNDRVEQASDITSTGRAAGHLNGAELDRLFVYDAGTNAISELDRINGAVLNSFSSPITPPPEWNPEEAHAALAAGPGTLVFGAEGFENLYELNPDTGEVVRTIPSAVAGIDGLAYANGRIAVTAEPSGHEIVPLEAVIMFRILAGSTSWEEPAAKGPYVVKLSDENYRRAIADGYLSNASSANNFPRSEYEDGSEDVGDTYWLCLEDHGGDWDFNDVMMKVTCNDDGTASLELSAGAVGHRNSIVDMDGNVLADVPSQATDIHLTVPMTIRQSVMLLDYETGELGKQLSVRRWNAFDSEPIEFAGGLAASGERLYGVSEGQLYQIDPNTAQAVSTGLLGSYEDVCTGLGILDGEIVASWLHEDGTRSVEVYDLASLEWRRTLSSDPAEPIIGVGSDAGDPDDYYSVSVNAGDVLTISTSTPGDGPGLIANDLDTAIELYDPNGALVAFDDNSAGDGRNATLTYSAMLSGAYVVRVLAEAGGCGQYVLGIDGHTGTMPSFEVVWPDLNLGSVATRDSGDRVPFHVRFNNLILATSADAEDMTIDGLPAAGMEFSYGDSIVFHLPGPLAEGSYTVSMPAGAVLNQQGAPNEPFEIQLVVDRVAPTVTDVIINDDLYVGTKVDSILVTFDEDISVRSAMLLHNTTTGGVFSTYERSATPGRSHTWDFSGASLSDGHYRAALRSDRAYDRAGNPLDGNSCVRPGGDYTFAFSVLMGDADGDLVVGAGDYDVLQGQLGMVGESLSADFNGDHRVDLDDFAIMRAQLGKSLDPRPELPGDANDDDAVCHDDMLVFRSMFGLRAPDLPADFDGDGAVGIKDFVLMRANYGLSLPWPAPVRPPAAPASASPDSYVPLSTSGASGGVVAGANPEIVVYRTGGLDKKLVDDDPMAPLAPVPMLDLIVGPLPAGSYTSELPAAIRLRKLAAADAHDLRPLTEDSPAGEPGEEFLADILAEALLVGKLGGVS